MNLTSSSTSATYWLTNNFKKINSSSSLINMKAEKILMVMPGIAGFFISRQNVPYNAYSTVLQNTWL